MGAETEAEAGPNVVVAAKEPAPPPGVSKKTLVTWKKQLKNLKTKDARKKIEGLRYCAHDEPFVREQSEVLSVLIDLLSRVKTPDVVAETLRTFHTLFTQTQAEVARPSSTDANGEVAAAVAPTTAVVELHPQQNRQFVVDASSAKAANAWKAGEPFVALFSTNVAPEIKIQAIEVFSVLLEHCTQLALDGEDAAENLVAFQSAGAPATALLSCLAVDHAALQLEALRCLGQLFQHPPNCEFFTAFHASGGLTKIQAFADKPDRRANAALLQIAESFSHHDIGREYLRATGMAGTVRRLLMDALETTALTIAAANATPTVTISLTLEDATLMHTNVAVAARVFARTLCAKEAPLTTAFSGECEHVPAVVETLVAILQRDINFAVTPAPAAAAAAPAGNNAAAQAAAAAAAATAATLAALFPFSPAKCVDVLTSLGRMAEASALVQRHVKQSALLPVLVQCFRVAGESALHQSADKLLHLCARVPPLLSETEFMTHTGTETEEQPPVDPQLFSAVQAAGEDATAVEKPALLTPDAVLPVLETAAVAALQDEDAPGDAHAVVFRLVRWLAVAVDAPANARVLGDAAMNVLVKILQETKPSETVLCGFLAKCIRAIALESTDACELCGTDARNPIPALTAFMHTAYPALEPLPTQRAASVASEIESLATLDAPPPLATELSMEHAAVHKLEWVNEFDELDTFEPRSLTQLSHAIDPFVFAATALEAFASAYARARSASPDASTTTDFAELLSQRLDASSKPAAAASAGAGAKKKPTGDGGGTSRSLLGSGSGEAVALCVLEKAPEVFTLLGSFSSKDGDVAVSLLSTVRALLHLPGGVRAMLALAKTAMDASPIVLQASGDASDEPGAESAPATTAPPAVHHANPSAWPWTREEAQRTEYGWLLAPILSVFEAPQTCFYQLEAAVGVLAAIVADAPSEATTTAPPATGGVISSVDVHIDDTDRFLNAALSQGALVYLLTILDSERVPRCPKDHARRRELAQTIIALALRLIERGTVKQAIAVAKRQELLDLHEQLTAVAAVAAAAATGPATGGAAAKHAKPDSNTAPTIDAASLHSQKLEYDSSWARELLDATFDVPRFDYRRVPALLLAVQLGQDEIALALLTAGAEPDAASALFGTTPLMLALLTNNVPLAHALLERGASVDAITQDGLDVCVWACALTAPVRDDLGALVARIHSAQAGTRPVLPLDALVELDAEQGAPDVALFEALLARGMDVNVSNADGDFVLHALLSRFAVRRRMRGLDMCFRYDSQLVDSAARQRLVAAVVERQGAQLDACNRLGQTPLHAALLYGHGGAALYLLEKGANPNVRDAFGLLPLHYACLGFFDGEEQAIQVVDALLAAAPRHELVQGVHTDPRKYKTALEKQAVDVEALLDRGLADVCAPPALARTLATVDDVLGCASQAPDGFLSWHLACGACSHLNASALCLPGIMDSRLHANGAERAAILSLLVRKYNVSLAARTAKQLSGLHLAVKTDVNGSNAPVLDVLLASPALGAVLNAVHEPTAIDGLLPIEDGARVELTTDALLYVPHAHVSVRSLQHKYHVILPNGNHLQELERHQLKPTVSSSSSSAYASRLTLRMESAFSALHYALQSSDELSRRLLDLPGIALQPEGSDLPLLALACAARRAPDVVSRLVTPQVNVRVYLPLHDGSSHEQSADGAARTAGGGSAGRVAGRKQAAALHFAVIYEDVALVRALVARKDHTNVNVRRSGDGFTPLHLACGMGNLEIAKLLLDFGANLIQMSTVSSSSSGVTPLHLLVKSDGMDNDKLRQLIHRGYVTREMLLEGLGAPAVVALRTPTPKLDEPRDAASTTSTDSLSGATLAGDCTEGDDMEISCVLLDEEEHNLSLFTHVQQLVAARRGATGYALRLQSELAKSDEVLGLFFQLIFGPVNANSGRNSSLTGVTEEETGASDTPRGAVVASSAEEASLLDARHLFIQLRHWHECYAQQQVRSQWTDPVASDGSSNGVADKIQRRSSFDRRSTRELLAPAASDAVEAT